MKPSWKISCLIGALITAALVFLAQSHCNWKYPLPLSVRIPAVIVMYIAFSAAVYLTQKADRSDRSEN